MQLATAVEEPRRQDARGPSRERLIEDHLPLVRCLARRFARRREDLEDLVQTGSIGLVLAANRYDEARGPFVAYAVPTIVGEIRRHLRDRSTLVRVPRRVQADRQAVRRAERELTGSLGRQPTRWELAARAHATLRDVERALASDHARAPVPLYDGGCEGAVDVASEDVWGDADDRILVEAALECLGERDRRLVIRRFFDDLSQEEIAREIGVSQVQVSRLLRAALDRMRRELDDRRVVRPRSQPYSGRDGHSRAHRGGPAPRDALRDLARPAQR